MTDVVLLSVLQGVAEFLPISSSGHLALAKQLLGLEGVGLRLDVALHFGTLLAVFVFYFSVIRRVVVNREWEYMLKVVLSAIPVGIVGVCFKNSLESLADNPLAVGEALIFTGVVLTLTRFLPRGKKDVSFYRALGMGLMQALAILPGVSRSGMTLVAARAGRIDAEKAAEFSFLMSAPPIVGAALLEIASAFSDSEVPQEEVSWLLCAFGAVLSALVGFFALKFLVKSLKSDLFWLFGPYCIGVGLFTAVIHTFA